MEMRASVAVNWLSVALLAIRTASEEAGVNCGSYFREAPHAAFAQPPRPRPLSLDTIPAVQMMVDLNGARWRNRSARTLRGMLPKGDQDLLLFPPSGCCAAVRLSLVLLA